MLALENEVNELKFKKARAKLGIEKPTDTPVDKDIEQYPPIDKDEIMGEVHMMISGEIELLKA